MQLVASKADGATKNYKFGPKNNWRRWLWNRIVEKLPIPTKEAVVLYLAGEDDLDRVEAVRRGFKPDNMVAVERDLVVSKALRQKGVTTIQNELPRVLWDWSRKREVRPNVIVADFCAGLSADAYNFLQAITRNPIQPAQTACVVAVNLMRGRDPGSNDARAAMAEWFKNNPSLVEESAKHRGQLFWHYVAGLQSELARVHGDQHLVDIGVQKFLMEPSYNSYKSGKKRFDSVVYKHVWAYRHKERDEQPYALGNTISAALAVRTMRFNGQLRPSSIW